MGRGSTSTSGQALASTPPHSADMARAERFELPLTILETAILPLDDTPIFGGRSGIRTHGGLPLTIFPRWCHRPLGHPSINTRSYPQLPWRRLPKLNPISRPSSSLWSSAPRREPAFIWGEGRESNSQLPEPQSGVLPIELPTPNNDQLPRETGRACASHP